MSRKREIEFRLRMKRDVGSLINALKHAGESHIRWRAADTLGMMRDQAGVEPLIEALKDRHPGVRRGAAWALGNIRDQRAVPYLIRSLEEDRDWRMRLVVTLALGRIGDGSAVDSLNRAVKGCSFIVATVAEKALERIERKKLKIIGTPLDYEIA